MKTLRISGPCPQCSNKFVVRTWNNSTSKPSRSTTLDAVDKNKSDSHVVCDDCNYDVPFIDFRYAVLKIRRTMHKLAHGDNPKKNKDK